MNQNDFLHYVGVYAVLLAYWVPGMDFFAGNVYYTAAGGFILFIITDKFAHKFLGVP